MKLVEVNDETSVETTLQWLFESELFERTSNRTTSGGMRQGYDAVNSSYPFVYSEITGYAISLATATYQRTHQQRLIEYARDAALFLRRIQEKANSSSIGAFPQGYSLPSLEIRPQYFSFDTAMCVQGLLDLYQIDPAPELLDSAKAAGNWLIDRMQFEDGAFRSLFDAETGSSEHISDEFFYDRSCLHAKHAICLLKLFAVVGDERYRDAAQNVCNWVLGLQDADGAFRSTERSQVIVSHAHAYATEGLLYAHHSVGNRSYLEAARRAGDWLTKVQQRDGSIAISYNERWWTNGRRGIRRLFPEGVADATAQAIRIWLILFAIYGDAQFVVAAQNARRFLLERQRTDTADPNARGGFEHSSRQPMMFAWDAMFAVQALQALEETEREGDVTNLIGILF